MAANVQLSERERTKVFIDIDTDRILGFAPENAVPNLPAGVRYKTVLCYHARHIENYVARYREQSLRDAEQATVRRLESERPFRKALFDAVVDRNNHLDERNKAINLALLKAMDFYYHNALNARRNAEIALVAERYEAEKKPEDIALESPFVKRGEVGHIWCTGDSVIAEMRRQG